MDGWRWTATVAGFLAGAALAGVPGLGEEGQADWRAYAEAVDHRAFAIAPGGAWSWVSGARTGAEAREKALAECRGRTEQKCLAYAVDDRIVFDGAAWQGLWGPYANREQARRASIGKGLGQRMFDLALADPNGRPTSVAAHRGRVVILHFWGSWCGPCRRELPDLQRLVDAMADNRDVVFMLLQARESIAVSRRWAEAQKLRLPLSDSGAKGDEDAHFRLAGGGRIADREVAARFPTTFVLDRQGMVVFSQVGPVHDWPAYKALLLDAAARSGR